MLAFIRGPIYSYHFNTSKVTGYSKTHQEMSRIVVWQVWASGGLKTGTFIKKLCSFMKDIPI